jgi:hypothetical protein
MINSVSPATRPGSAIKRLSLLLTVGGGLLSLFLVGCPGSLDPGVGAGGGSGGAGGSGGPCNPTPVFTARCTSIGCHNSSGAAAGLDLQSANPAARLVGVGTGTGTGAACSGQTLLNPGSNPATGVFIDKITTPTCGLMMPETGGALSAGDLACLTSWATSVTMNAVGGDQ